MGERKEPAAKGSTVALAETVTGYDGGETQYGTGCGDLYVLGGYYEIEPVGRHQAREIALRCLRREHGRWLSGEAQHKDAMWSAQLRLPRSEEGQVRG